jgi:hypothetical protein
MDCVLSSHAMLYCSFLRLGNYVGVITLSIEQIYVSILLTENKILCFMLSSFTNVLNVL